MPSSALKQPKSAAWCLLVALLASLVAGAPARAQAPALPTPQAPALPAPQAAEKPVQVGPDGRVRVYKLETLELRGTTRMTTGQLAEELGLVPETRLDDELVMSTRTRLLGLGLFKSAILLMRKGSKPGYARLIVEVEDDDSVLSDWALGGELDVTVSETNASSTVESDGGTVPMDYRLGLVGRNVFDQLHRASAFVDVDGEGIFRAGQIAYGLPRFAKEDAQFDAEIAAVDVSHRYLDALGFGAHGQGLWSRTLASGSGEVQYGAAMYVNKKPRFAVPGFPQVVAGPKVAYYHETRLRGFFPDAGHLLGASLLLAPTRADRSVIELSAARTFGFGDLVWWTLESRAASVGVHGYALRAETRWDVPLGGKDPGEDQAAFFLRLRAGQDRLEKTDLVGSAAILGVRYHSNGFIAELALKVTKTPEELTPTKIGVKSEGAE
jgi:hypothetical protein